MVALIFQGAARTLAPVLAEFQRHYEQRNEAMARACRSGACAMKDIGDYFGIHHMTVSRAVQQFEKVVDDE
ncbi:MAG: hypothetical protein DSZ32_02960 [Gammaproteobacteria bacterium]|nr:MAG: hypothetical protein DSZ32_02960 [Gammaproteobacteria bacterium]